ncbi:hypothetical protein BH23ACT4_BH23ACT4_11630 [soil metagenome]
MTFMSVEGSRQRKWIFPVAAGTILLALALIALFREPVVLDSATPEGTVQAFLQAIADNDYDKARDQLSPDLKEECSSADIARAGPFESFTATLGDVNEFGEETLVHITIREGGSGLDTYTYDPGPYRLQMESGRWGITEASWPYFFYECAL